MSPQHKMSTTVYHHQFEFFFFVILLLFGTEHTNKIYKSREINWKLFNVFLDENEMMLTFISLLSSTFNMEKLSSTMNDDDNENEIEVKP